MRFGSSKVIAAFFLLACFCIDFRASSIDTITSSQFIKDPEFVVSPGNTFKLGFFSLVNSTNRYVGIWHYEKPMITPIWIANRNKPLKDSSGIMKVYEDGNLVVLNGNGEVLWSSSVSTRVDNSSAVLTDVGDLVLRDNNNGNIIWESFQHPVDSFVSGMKLTANQRTQEKILLTSWKDPSDPSIGSFSVGMDVFEIPQIFIWKGNRPYWRSGQWNGRIFIGVPDMASGYLDGFLLEGDRSSGNFSFRFTYIDKSHPNIFVLSPEGTLIEKMWSDSTKSWQIDWQTPENECDIYGVCGEFGVCNPKNSPVCSCLKGFEPKIADEWSRGKWTGGCVRSRLLQCERIKTGDEAGKYDEFSKLGTVKVPDLAYWSPSLEQECEDNCLNNCSCIAYSYFSDVGCMSWTGNLIDIRKFSSGGADLYIRLAYSELDNNRNLKVIVGVAVVIGVITISIFAFFMWRWMAKYKEGRRKNREMLLVNINENHPTFSDVNMLVDSIDKVKLQELPVFSLQKLALATGNFDVANKLGQGGFGPVYKGKLSDRREIAVKRLSRASGQGLEEFMNEVVVISKLQHRNLVRLFGCCVEGEEKMLVYEYMPNKSLDAFLFDPSKKQVLDWRKRFHIIEGICRGLLYLHRDSRLRIIHRDLKASNILLDQELNPKISDFGMARIFGGNEDQANTRRVVGTYGYMSPEYAMEGRFSEKSDVFSFGVLLLEIVSGRRNTSFYENEQALSLLGFAWKLWNEGNNAALVDPVVSDPCYQAEILRCIHVGLLCVQEFAKDRPTVSTVISMLNSEIVDLPIPKQPAFTVRQVALDSAGSSQQSLKNCSINLVTLTVVDAR